MHPWHYYLSLLAWSSSGGLLWTEALVLALAAVGAVTAWTTLDRSQPDAAFWRRYITGAAVVLITHDLGVVAGLCDQVHVMYSGRIVESAPRRPLFADPQHPYTTGLLASVPRLDQPRGIPLLPIPGSPSDTLAWTKGCAFSPRCTRRIAQCLEGPPALLPVEGAPGSSHLVRCVNPVPEEEQP